MSSVVRLFENCYGDRLVNRNGDVQYELAAVSGATIYAGWLKLLSSSGDLDHSDYGGTASSSPCISPGLSETNNAACPAVPGPKQTTLHNSPPDHAIANERTQESQAVATAEGNSTENSSRASAKNSQSSSSQTEPSNPLLHRKFEPTGATTAASETRSTTSPAPTFSDLQSSLPPVDETGFYKILGVFSNSSDEEIKKAYFRRVREHPPEKDPEGFRVIRGAYETLSDPKARKKYDALRKHGDEIVRLFSDAQKHREAKEWREAEKCLKRLLVLAPEEDAARNSLGLVHLEAGKSDEAVSAFEVLTKREPDIPVYWMNFGYAYCKKGDELKEKEGIERQKQFYDLARECFQKAIELEPFNGEPYLEIARLMVEFKDYDKALEYCEKSVAADGKEDFQDFEALYYMCVIHFYRNSKDSISMTAKRLLSVAPDSQEAKKYAAARFAYFGHLLFEARIFEIASEFLRAATIFDPEDKDIVEYQKAADKISKAYNEWDRLQNDSLIVPPIRRLAAIMLCDYGGEEIKDRKSVVNEIFNELNHYAASMIATSIDKLKLSYPVLYNTNEALFKEINDLAKGIKKPQQSSGCFVATAAFGTPYEPIIDIYREYRDKHLSGSTLGRLAIRCYAVLGPLGARLVIRSDTLKRVTAWTLALLAPWISRRI
jgi:tetratricopeptide (TPR) repeat protein